MRSSLKLTPTIKFGKQEIRKFKIIVNCLYEASDSFDFREPVDWKGMGLTDYLSIVKYPMDLSTVMKKLKEERYSRVEEGLDDLQLIWDNCKAYNPQNSWIHSVAQKLERSFKKMVRNYFPDLNVTIPTKPIEEQKDAAGPANLFEDDGQDITYQQKLKFSQELSFLSSEHLSKVLDEIIARCPQAYHDMGQGKGQILVDNMDLIFFNQISIMARNLLTSGSGQAMQDEEQDKTAKPRGRGRPPGSQKST